MRRKKGGDGGALLDSSLVKILQIPPWGAPLTSTSLTRSGEDLDLLTGDVTMGQCKGWREGGSRARCGE